MPSKAEHFNKANANASFAEKLPLTSGVNIDWALTALFYAAVHYVESYMAERGMHHKSHETRDRYMSRDAHLRHIYKEYGHLKFYGHSARYEMTKFTREDVTDKGLPALAKLKNHLFG